MSWKCQCGLVLVRAVQQCPSCQSLRPSSAIATDEFDLLGFRIKHRYDTDIKGNEMEEDLFKEFFIQTSNHERLVYTALDYDARKEHREKMRKILQEAKIRYQVDTDIDREDKSKLAADKKSWLVTDDSPNPLVSDAIAAVKTRANRMSKADKLKKQLEEMGIDDDTIKTMVSAVEKKATNSQLDKLNFNNGNKQLADTKKAISLTKPASEADGKLFNPSDMFGAKS